jgi:hypothetical protein
MTRSQSTKKSISLPRLLLYVFALSGVICVNVFGVLSTGYLPVKELAGTALIAIAIFVPPYFYKKLPNGVGATRGLEHGPKWQLHEHIKRQSKVVQALYRWINRLRGACLGVVIGGFLIFVGIGVGISTPTIFIGWFIGGVAWSFWWILNGIGTFIIRAGSFPKELLIGQREFVRGRKAICAGASRIVIGLLLLITPINFLYSTYRLITGRL